MAVVRADTYELNFQGNLEAKLAASRAAAAALESQFGDAKSALKTLQDAANEELFAKSPIAKARADVRALGADFRAAGAQAKAAERDFAAAVKAAEKKADAEQKAAVEAYKFQQKAAVEAYKFQQKAAQEKDKAGAAGVKAMFGTSVFDLAAGKIAGAFGKGHEETEAIKSTLLEAGGGFATAIGGAALAIGAAGVGLVAAGLKFGIENTAQRQKNTAILDRLTGGQGAEAEEFSKKLAGDTGTSEDKAMERVKGLIQAKFGKEDTGAIFRASADIGEVKGEGKAELFIKTLEKVQLAGSASEKSVKALLGAGVERSELLEGLKETGETTEAVEARLKAGKVSANEFTKAATSAVQKDIGGVAGKGLDAMFNRAKIAADDLFDNFDLSGIEALGGKVTEALGGETGAGLKVQITAAANSILDLTKNITAADIKGAFATAGEAATTAAAAIKTAATAAADLWNTIKQVKGSGSHTEQDKGGLFGSGTDETIQHEIEQANLREQIRADQRAAREKEKAEAAKAAVATGVAYGEGFAQGIEASSGKPIAAAAATGKGVVAAGNAAIKAKSPSREGEQSGGWYDEGWERGIAGNADKPAAAARAMGGGVVKAGNAGIAGSSPAASANGAVAGGDVSIQYAPVFHFSDSTPDSVRAELKKAIDEMTPAMLARLLAGLRQNGRDSREGPRT